MERVPSSMIARGVKSDVAKHATKDVVKHFGFVVATDYNCITFAVELIVLHFIGIATAVRKFLKLKIIYLPCLSTMHTWEVFSFKLSLC